MPKSYFYANVSEFGNRSFFTYYGEFERSWDFSGLAEAMVLFLIFGVSMATNVAIIVAVVKYRILHTVTNYFIANLAVADITFALSIPFAAVTRLTETWIFGLSVCKMMMYFQFVCSAVIIWSLCLISIDRYRCIVVPPLRAKLTSRQAAMAIVATWMAFLVISVPVALWFTVMECCKDDEADLDGCERVTICTLLFPFSVNIRRYSIVLIVFFIAVAGMIPGGILLFNYHKIFSKLTERRQNWAGLPSPPPAISSIEVSEPDCSVDFTFAEEPIAPHQRAAVKGRSSSRFVLFRSHKYQQDPGMDDDGSCSSTVNSWSKARGVSLEEARRSRHYRAVKILVSDVVVVILMWLPICLMICLIYVDNTAKFGKHNIQSHQFIYCLSLAYANTCANAVLYGILNDNFRRTFCSSCKTRTRRRKYMQELVNHHRHAHSCVVNAVADGGGGDNNNLQLLTSSLRANSVEVLRCETSSSEASENDQETAQNGDYENPPSSVPSSFVHDTNLPGTHVANVGELTTSPE